MTAGVAALLLASASLLAGCGLPRLWEPSRRQVLDRILPSAVQVVVEQQEGRRVRAGSGVIIGTRRGAEGPECLVLTSGHTVSGTLQRSDISVVFDRHRGAGAPARAKLLALRETATVDAALLAAPAGRCAPAAPARPPAIGEPVWVVAFPWGGPLTVASGIVSQVQLDGAAPGSRPARLMIDALVGYGASGSGVFAAASGRLLGIIEGYGTSRVTAQGGSQGWYIDVPMPGQTMVTPLADIRRFLGETEHAQVLGGDP
jgi:S1-C subfamily serine protease